MTTVVWGGLALCKKLFTSFFLKLPILIKMTSLAQKIFRSFFLICVNGSCLAFVIWKTLQCLRLYHAHPVGTQLSLEESSNLPFPAITVCGGFGEEWPWKVYNQTYLEKICNIRWRFKPILSLISLFFLKINSIFSYYINTIPDKTLLSNIS